MKALLVCTGLCFALLALPACGGYDACGDKNCGDPCTVCDPDDSDCVESQEAKSCNVRGVCATAANNSCG
ncbi:MAG: hypothetical protein RMA76_10575 [Deltaproteobacteria bacterium]|jgi:hypothetical protein